MGLRELVDPTKAFQTQPSVQVSKWEYAVVQLSDLSESVLTRALATMGSFGWELCEQRVGGVGLGRRQLDNAVVLVFKRQAA